MATTRSQFFNILKDILAELRQPMIAVSKPRISVDNSGVVNELKSLNTDILAKLGTMETDLETIASRNFAASFSTAAWLNIIKNQLFGIDEDTNAIRLTNIDIESNTTGLATQATIAAIAASLVLIVSDMDDIRDIQTTQTTTLDLTFTVGAPAQQMSLGAGKFRLISVDQSKQDSASSSETQWDLVIEGDQHIIFGAITNPIGTEFMVNLFTAEQWAILQNIEFSSSCELKITEDGTIAGSEELIIRFGFVNWDF